MFAFRELVERYKKKIYYLAYDLTGNHHDAEDMSQEVFIKAFRSLKNFRGDAKLSSWLYRITVNTA
ncbi:MAG: sigma-70 family RNA polymerase sigma factor, partial [Bacteroidales bacterium]|nr:sigma-70 family RNA polymerase sigma factor [Bacteroidales bacterium]